MEKDNSTVCARYAAGYGSQDLHKKSGMGVIFIACICYYSQDWINRCASIIRTGDRIFLFLNPVSKLIR